VARTLECERRVVGEGFAVRRGIGRKELDSLDPFISLDEFECTYCTTTHLPSLLSLISPPSLPL
jgi:hypothetical protein